MNAQSTPIHATVPNLSANAGKIPKKPSPKPPQPLPDGFVRAIDVGQLNDAVDIMGQSLLAFACVTDLLNNARIHEGINCERMSALLSLVEKQFVIADDMLTTELDKV